MLRRTEPIRVGTRASRLARVQAAWVVERLHQAWADLPFCTVELVTEGDVVRDRRLSDMGGRGVFVKEIEEALIGDRVDLAVHSLKDLPSSLPEGLVIGAVPGRIDPRDVLITRDGHSFEDLPTGVRMGTGSVRRAAQLKAARPDLEFVSVRGNVDTRLRKLVEEVDGITGLVLAAAGLTRLGMLESPQSRWAACPIPTEICLPAVGQGALAIELRGNDSQMAQIAARIDEPVHRWAIEAERAFLGRVGGGCHLPVGAMAAIDGDDMMLEAVIAMPDGTQVIRGSCRGDARSARALGRALAEELLARGGADVLSALAGREA